MRPTNRFTKGTGLFTCRICKRKTRDTGRGDNEHISLCAECYDLGGEENHLSDTGKFYDTPENVLHLIERVGQLGGDTKPWDELKAAALREVEASKPAARPLREALPHAAFNTTAGALVDQLAELLRSGTPERAALGVTASELGFYRQGVLDAASAIGRALELQNPDFTKQTGELLLAALVEFANKLEA